MSKASAGRRKPAVGVAEAERKLVARFGDTGQPIEWYGLHEHGIGERLVALKDVILSTGILAQLSEQSTECVKAYITARLTSRRKPEGLPDFEIAVTDTWAPIYRLGSLAAAMSLLGRETDPLAFIQDDDLRAAHYISACGLLASVISSSTKDAADADMFGLLGVHPTDIIIQEIRPEVQGIVQMTVAEAAKTAP